jgi:hypothetical protein
LLAYGCSSKCPLLAGIGRSTQHSSLLTFKNRGLSRQAAPDPQQTLIATKVWLSVPHLDEHFD